MTSPEGDAPLAWRDKRDLVVGAGLARVPVVGRFLAQVWSNYRTAKRFVRIERFLAELRDDVDALGDQAGQPEMSDRQREEVPSLIEEVLDRVERESQEQKAAWLRAFMAGAFFQREGWDLSQRLVFLRLLNDLTVGELFLLTYLRRFRRLWLSASPARHAVVSGAVEIELPFTVSWGKAYLAHLESAALIKKDILEPTFSRDETAFGRRAPLAVEDWVLDQIGSEFLASFAFPDGTEVFLPPWDELAERMAR